MRFSPILGFALLAACSSALESGPVQILGTYALVSVDAAPLPFRTASALTVRGAITLNGDGRYTLAQTDSASTGSLSVFSSAGHWGLESNALQLVDDNGSLLLAIVVSDTVRMDYRSHQNVYLRK